MLPKTLFQIAGVTPISSIDPAKTAMLLIDIQRAPMPTPWRGPTPRRIPATPIWETGIRFSFSYYQPVQIICEALV